MKKDAKRFDIFFILFILLLQWILVETDKVEIFFKVSFAPLGITYLLGRYAHTIEMWISIILNFKDNEMEKWSKIRKKGKKHYVWIRMVLIRCVIIALLGIIGILFFFDPFLIKAQIVAFIICPFLLYFNGLSRWNLKEKKYKEWMKK